MKIKWCTRIISVFLMVFAPVCISCQFDNARLEIEAVDDLTSHVVYRGIKCDTKEKVASYILKKSLDLCKKFNLEIDLEVKIQREVYIGSFSSSGPSGAGRSGATSGSYESAVADAIVTCKN